jgi:hypothetical protein
MAATNNNYEALAPYLDGLKDVRSQIDSGTCSAFKSDWTRIPLGKKGGLANGWKGQLEVKEWYKRDVASFVPHKLFPGYVPFCPSCKLNDRVRIANSRWVNKPRIMYGMDDYCLLVTKRYPCDCCNGAFFNAYEKDSMKLGGLLIQSSFPFF